jgi:L-lactate dehydrogenase complex protein LldG
MNDDLDSTLETLRKHFPLSEDHPPPLRTSYKDLLELFQKNLANTGVCCYNSKDIETARKTARKIFPEAIVVCSTTDEWMGNITLTPIKRPQDYSEVDLAVIRAKFGVASNGMLWVPDVKPLVNVLGFVAKELILLLDPAQIIDSMTNAYLKLQLEPHPHGCFMAGPKVKAVEGEQGFRDLVVMLVKPGQKAA